MTRSFLFVLLLLAGLFGMGCRNHQRSGRSADLAVQAVRLRNGTVAVVLIKQVGDQYGDACVDMLIYDRNATNTSVFTLPRNRLDYERLLFEVSSSREEVRLNLTGHKYCVLWSTLTQRFDVDDCDAATNRVDYSPLLQLSPAQRNRGVSM